MKTRYALASLLAATLPAAALAQTDSTMNRTVVVENQYIPDLMEATKLNLYPGVEEQTTPSGSVEYARSLRPVTGWGHDVMPMLADDFADDDATHGFIRLGYGTRGRADLAAGYSADLTRHDRLSLGASLDGWDGKRPTLYQRDGNSNWTSRLYRTRIGADYSHQFDEWKLTAGATWQNQVFNYLPNAGASGYNHQRLTGADVHVGVATTDKTLPLQVSLQTGLRTLKIAHPLAWYEATAPGATERQIHTVGSVMAPINDTQRIGVDFNMDNMFYSWQSDSKLISNYTAIGLNPYFGYDDGGWRIRLGVHVDPQLGGTDKGVDVAPDVRLERVFHNHSVLYLHALGGRELNDFRRLTALSPWTSVLQGETSTYVRLNATLGFKMSPMPGLWFHVFGGYQIRDHEVFAVTNTFPSHQYLQPVLDKGKLTFGGAEAKYDYKDVMSVEAKLTFYGWKLDNYANSKEVMLAWKPRYEGSLQAQGRIYPGLRILAGIELADRRNGGDNTLFNLYTGASYDLVHRLTIFARVNNILNKEYRDVNLYPAEKLGLLAGIRWKF
jgi:hypothetical protein